jgi:arylsulfatase A-like enzyme
MTGQPRLKRDERPNIIFIIADQLAAGFVGCYGSGVNSTPTLDRLAADGVRFDRCYAHSPVCAPNRATMFTGRSVQVHGIVTNNLVLRTDNPTYPQVCQRYGYRTGGYGKYHMTSMQLPLPRDFGYLGFDESVPTEDPRLGPWLDWIQAEHPAYYRRALSTCWPMPYLSDYGPEERDLRPEWESAVAEFMAPRRAASAWRMMYTSPLPPELQQTTYITDLGLDFMARHIHEHEGRPFLCQLSYVNPHDPYDPPAPYDTMFDPANMTDPLPITWDRDEIEALEHSRDWGGFRAVYENPAAVHKMRALYHGSIRLIDDQIGRIVAFLREHGMWENTVLLFTTDHGDMMGDHGLMTKGVKHYDKSARVPLIACGAGIGDGIESDRLTSSLDIYPTLCEWAGATVMPPHEGRSFAHAAQGDAASDPGWDTVTVRVNQVRSIITADGWRLTVYDEDRKAQMFNLVDDPQEQRNLYYDEGWSEKQTELYERFVRAYMRACVPFRYGNLPVVDGQRVFPSPSLREPMRPAY